jgi:uncharacterized protein YneF (UPF0154 family)
MKTLRLPLFFVASLVLGYFIGRKHLSDRYPAAPAEDR